MKKLKAGSEERVFKTRDGISITANYYPASSPTLKKGGKGGFSRSAFVGEKYASSLIILAPGFAKYKDAYPMTEMCEDLTHWGDVLCLDFRGVGKSGGRYTFGAEEYLDLEPLLRWGKKNYKQTVLLGLSLGSYHSLRAAHAWPRLVDKLLLVSCPSSLEDILLTWGPIRQSLAIATDWKALRKRLSIEFNLFFKWGNPLSAKPNAAHLAGGLKMPTAFLVGGKDRLVVKSLSRKVFEKVSAPKSWVEIPKGNHAEFLYLENPVEFGRWLQHQLKKRIAA